MIETDLARIASALETLADAYCRQVDTTARFLDLDVDSPPRTDVDLYITDLVPEPEPKEFVKPGPGPGRGKKKPKPDDVQKMDTTENPTQADTTAPAAEVPDTVPETDTSPASPSELEAPAAPAIPEVTLEDVSRAVVAMAKVKTRDEIMAVWKPFGISRGSELKPEQFFDALMAIKEAMRA